MSICMWEDCLHPPPHDDDEDDPLPSWAIMDHRGYIGNHENATTARGRTRDGKHRIRVTFCVRRPPLVSHICVHSPDFPSSDAVFLREPRVIATEGNLALIHLVIGCPGGRYNDYGVQHRYIYKADPSHNRRPSLHPLPPFPYRSPPYTAFYGQFALLCPPILRPHSDSDGYFYTVAALTLSEDAKWNHFDLLLLHTGDDRWTCKTVSLEALENFRYGLYVTNAVTIGGEHGTIAFADIHHGVLLCDALLDDPVLRFFPLPPPLQPDRELLGRPEFRDIAYVQGHIKYVELQRHHTANDIPAGWTAAIWTLELDRTATSSEENWRCDCQVQSCDLTADKNPVQFELLAKLQSAGEKGKPQSDLGRLYYIGQPKFSLQQDNVVHFLTIAERTSRTAQVIAVDVSNKELQGVVDSGRRLMYGIRPSFVHSRVSACLSPGKMFYPKRPGTPLLGSLDKMYAMTPSAGAEEAGSSIGADKDGDDMMD